MNELQTYTDTQGVVLLTREEAEVLDLEIEKGASELQQRLLLMYNGEGYKAIGYDSWGAYLDSVSERAGIGTKALRRWHKASLLLDSGGYSPTVLAEGSARPLIDTLSDRKGYTEQDRLEALELAIELAGGNIDDVTGPIARTAAQYVSVVLTAPEDGSGLVERLRDGEITTEHAYHINNMMHEKAASGMEPILAELSDPALASFLINLRQNGKAAYKELEETIMASGHLPTRTDEQIPIGKATLSDVTMYLDEPGRLRRYEKAVERTQAYKEAATLAAAIVVSYWGVHERVPYVLHGEHRKNEAKLYQLLLDLGLIKYGINNEDS